MSVAKLKNLVSRLKTVESKAKAAIDKSIREHTPEWEEMQRQRITEGEDTQGKDIQYNKPRSTAVSQSDAYVPSYARERRKDGLQTDHVDLKRTGTYQNSIKGNEKGPGKLQFEATDPKAEFIEDNYDNVLGFSPEQKKIVKEQVGADLLRAVKTAIKP